MLFFWDIKNYHSRAQVCIFSDLGLGWVDFMISTNVS